MLLLFARCADFIDVVPENSTTFTSFFQTEKDAEALLNSLKSQERKMVLNQIYEPHVSAGLLVDSTQDLEINQAKGLDIIATHKMDVKKLITEEISLDKIPYAMQQHIEGKAIKFLVKP